MAVIEYDGKNINMDDKYSFKDFTTEALRDDKDLKDINIFSSCFSKEIPGTKVFPDDMKGVVFYNCNLDNVFIPAGNTLIGCRNNKFKVQNDGIDWYLNEDLTPKEPIEKEEYLKLGLSINPKDLPAKRIEGNIIKNKRQELSTKII